MPDAAMASDVALGLELMLPLPPPMRPPPSGGAEDCNDNDDRLEPALRPPLPKEPDEYAVLLGRR